MKGVLQCARRREEGQIKEFEGCSTAISFEMELDETIVDQPRSTGARVWRMTTW